MLSCPFCLKVHPLAFQIMLVPPKYMITATFLLSTCIPAEMSKVALFIGAAQAALAVTVDF